MPFHVTRLHSFLPCLQFTMFKVEEKKIKCGIPASGDLYAMCFQAASDVMMAFKEVGMQYGTSRSSAI